MLVAFKEGETIFVIIGKHHDDGDSNLGGNVMGDFCAPPPPPPQPTYFTMGAFRHNSKKKEGRAPPVLAWGITIWDEIYKHIKNI